MANKRRKHKKRSILPRLLLILAALAVLIAAALLFGMNAEPKDAQQPAATAVPTAEPTPAITSAPAAPSPDPTPVPMAKVEPLYTLDPTPEPQRYDNKYPYVIVVNYKAQLVRVYTMDENGMYTVLVKDMLTSTGKTRICEPGIYKTKDYRRWHLFLDGTYGQYVIRINNHFLFHSIPYKKHGRNDTLISKYWDQLGDNVSGGCMRLMAKDAKWLFDNCPKGTPIIVTKGKAVDQSVYDAIVQPPLVSGKWDPTDPDPNNPDYFDESDATPPPTCYPYATPVAGQLEKIDWY